MFYPGRCYLIKPFILRDIFRFENYSIGIVYDDDYDYYDY